MVKLVHMLQVLRPRLAIFAAGVVASPAVPCEAFFASLFAESWLRQWRGLMLANGCNDSWVPVVGTVYNKYRGVITAWFPFRLAL